MPRGMRLSEDEFEQLVVDALDSLPQSLLEMLDNVDVVIEPRPTREHMQSVNLRRGTLFGLYQGVPLTQRNNAYSIVAPDKITIFQRPIERACSSKKEIAQQVRKTVVHELAHHFGIDEERIRELGWG